MNLPPPVSSLAVFKLLCNAARLRAAGRLLHQRKLLRQIKGSDSNVFGWLTMFIFTIFMIVAHLALGWTVVKTLETARIMEMESRGKLMISSFENFFLESLTLRKEPMEASERDRPADTSSSYHAELARKNLEWLRRSEEQFFEGVASWRQREMGDVKKSDKRLIEEHYRKNGSAGFISEDDLPKLRLYNPESVPAGYWPFVGAILLLWLLMLVLEGDGMHLDFSKRQHPMWEWLLSHPVRPVAAFSAEMLSPLMANPIYLTAPVFWGVVLGNTHGVVGGVLGGVLIGLPLAVAASSLNKALEISAMLRLSTRNRGAVLGLMAWAGFVAMILPMFLLTSRKLNLLIMEFLAGITPWLPQWPMQALTVGWGNKPVLWQVIVTGFAVAVPILALAMIIACWGLRRGLQADNAAAPRHPSAPKNSSGPSVFAGNPLFRKELLWFRRDKSAVVQAILIPLSIAVFQFFNLRGLLEESTISQWNSICGVAIICGTYFLLVLGPRSLASEGAALWIAMTWPKGMEDLLKAKARLWWMLSNGIVGFILIVTVVMYPADWWKIGLVALAWWFFGRSLALQTVTLVTAPSSSGEPQSSSKGRLAVVMVGALAFATGVSTQAWHIALMGVVFSALAGAAIWQNFRARLPYLFDPWSEKQPPAPSLMHAMVGITVLTLIIVIVNTLTASAGQWQAVTIAFGTGSFITWIFMQRFLKSRGVGWEDIWIWKRDKPLPNFAISCGYGLAAGAILSGLWWLYSMGLEVFPPTSGWMAEMARNNATQIGHKIWIFIPAVAFAPLAEEYFFRGLLFRTLDREWGGWRALIGSTAFFTLYHPPLSWIPAFVVGLTCALLFKKYGRLLPCVLLHMVNNAVVVGLS